MADDTHLTEDDALPEDPRPAREPEDPRPAPASDGERPPSRSALKRDAEHRQQLGATLTTLSAEVLDKLNLPPRLRDALDEYGRLRARGAKRRQLQFIGALMRDLDPAPIQNLIDDLEGQSASARYAHHQVEAWRERLIKDPGALTEFIDSYPSVDRQQLRQRIDKARKAAPDGVHKRALRDLFRFLKEPIDASLAASDAVPDQEA